MQQTTDAQEGYQAPDPSTALPTFTRSEVESINDGLTMGDSWRAKKIHPDDKNAAGMRAFQMSAVRLGIHPAGTDLESFLDRIAVDDFNAVIRPGSVHEARKALQVAEAAEDAEGNEQPS